MYISKIMRHVLIMVLLISCEDEITQNQIVAQFEKTGVSVGENEGKLTVKIDFANTLGRSGELTVGFSNIDGARFTTVPALEQNQLKLNVQPGQSQVSFDINLIDNGVQDENVSFELSLSSSSDHITIGSTKKLSVNIVDDEGSFSIVQFDAGAVTLNENAGNYPIRITYSKPAPSNGFIKIRVESNSTESFTTSPATVSGFVRVPFQAGQTESYFDIIPVSNHTLDGDRVILLTITEVSDGILFGDINSINVTIMDDNSISTINFQLATSTARENSTSHLITFSLSSPAKSDGMVEVDFQSELAYGTHFTTEPAQLNGKIEIPVSTGELQVEFNVLFINDALINGNRSIDFTIANATGTVVAGEYKSHRLWINDDELSGRPKGYESFGGGWRSKRWIEYNERGEISLLHWDRNTPGYSEGTMSYHYDASGRIIKLVENPVTERTYTWENNRIVKAERFNSGVLRQYTLYSYDDAGNIGEVAVFDIQPNGEFVHSLLFVYLYYTNGNIYKQLSYAPIGDTGEYSLLTTKTYEDYHLDKVNPFSMVEILPGVNSQPNLPGSYRVEEGGNNILYHLTYEFNAEGLPVKRTASSSSASEVTNYEYY